MQPTILQASDYRVACFFHDPAVGETLEDTIAPDYWAHVASRLAAGNRIELLAADGTWWAMLIVRAAGRTDALVQVLQYVPLGAQESTLDASAYEVKWRGPKRRWGVVRTKDGAVLQDDFAVREAADTWMADHLKALAA